MNLDHFHTKSYDFTSYNCLHFASEVWESLTGNAVLQLLSRVLGTDDVTAELRRRFRILTKPQDPCLVLMRSLGKDPHVGIWVNGAVLHIGPDGVRHVPLWVASIGFTSIKFVLPC
jgi:hypothetical protein